MSQQKILFIDRDGTLIREPADFQIDAIEKLSFMPGVIPALLRLKTAGFSLVMITNQDGLGTPRFPHDNFVKPHELMLQIFASQGIEFDSIRICPHMPEDNCDCRKPKIGLILDYLTEQKVDLNHSYVIGDRITDLQLAEKLKLPGLQITDNFNWHEIANTILAKERIATLSRQTKETSITATVNLDRTDTIAINTGIGFFDHMLEQLAKHGGFSLSLVVKGDLHIDDHHTIEDTAIVLGETLKKALHDKYGIGRYGFVLPMDESLAQTSIDLSGRSYLVFDATFNRENIGDLSTELIPHFFRSFTEGLKATLHITVTGENTHHQIEAIFKSVGRSLRQAIAKTDSTLPSTKGIL